MATSAGTPRQLQFVSLAFKPFTSFTTIETASASSQPNTYRITKQGDIKRSPPVIHATIDEQKKAGTIGHQETNTADSAKVPNSKLDTAHR